MKYCLHCGKGIPNISAFCPKCGNSCDEEKYLAEEQYEQEEYSQVQYSEQIDEEYEEYEEYEDDGEQYYTPADSYPVDPDYIQEDESYQPHEPKDKFDQFLDEYESTYSDNSRQAQVANRRPQNNRTKAPIRPQEPPSENEGISKVMVVIIAFLAVIAIVILGAVIMLATGAFDKAAPTQTAVTTTAPQTTAPQTTVALETTSPETIAETTTAEAPQETTLESDDTTSTDSSETTAPKIYIPKGVTAPTVTYDTPQSVTIRNTVSSGLSLRKGPGTENEKILTMPEGSQIFVYGEGDVPNWRYVRFSDGTFGWCCSVIDGESMFG